MECTREVIEKFQRIRWRSAVEITDEAEALIKDHLSKMSVVLKFIETTRQVSPADAYAEAQSAGYNSEGYKAFMHELFTQVEFQGAGVREHIILAAAACCFWPDDPELYKLENPWIPLLKLYEAGYTSSFDENEKGKILTLLIGYQGNIKSYPLN